MRALVVAHDPDSLPTMVGERLETHGIELDLLVLTESDAGPQSNVEFPDPTGYDMIVPMGSVWSVYDDATIGSWVGRELAMLAHADEMEVPILGICFGGQALASALGGDTVRSAEPQIGWFEIDSIVPEIASGPWLEWHYDQIEAPPGAEILAKDDTYVQAFRRGKSVGLQFHPEVSPDHLAAWLSPGTRAELAKSGVDSYVLAARTSELFPLARANTNRLVDWFLSEVVGLDLGQG